MSSEPSSKMESIYERTARRSEELNAAFARIEAVIATSDVEIGEHEAISSAAKRIEEAARRTIEHEKVYAGMDTMLYARDRQIAELKLAFDELEKVHAEATAKIALGGGAK